jgi:hypothetical protein
MPMSIRGVFSITAGLIAGLIAAGVLWGCRAEETPAVQTACAPSDAEVQAWIETPTLPDNPAGTDPACFFELAWQELFAVTQREKGVPRFTAWPPDRVLFPEAGSPPPWKAAPAGMIFRQLRKGLGIRNGHVDADIVTEAAALTPLTDQRGRWAHYSVVVNQNQYEYIRCCDLYQGACFNDMAGLGEQHPGTSLIDRPDTSIELKMAWRVLETCDLPDSPAPCVPEDASRYLTVMGEVDPYSTQVPGRKVKLGLVGMHIVQKTSRYKDSIWATFEHVDNAPDCSQKADPPPSGWSFFNPDCQDPDKIGRCEANAYCAPCPIQVPADVAATFNADPKNTWKIPAGNVITCVPADATIEFNKPVEMADGTEQWINLFDPECTRPTIPTQVCRSEPIALAAPLNEQVRRVLARLGGDTAVLANYELAGTIWYDSGGASPVLQPAAETALSNTTMETYLQSLNEGCVTCHSLGVKPAPETKEGMLFNSTLADRSMVFQQMRQFGGKCDSTKQAASCKAWSAGCPGG